MRLSLLASALTFATYAHAAAVTKRDVSAPVQTCISDLHNAGINYFDNVSKAFSDMILNPGIVHTQSIAYASYLIAPSTSCCAFTSETEEESTAVINALADLVPHIESIANVAAQIFSENNGGKDLAPINKLTCLTTTEQWKIKFGLVTNCLNSASVAALQETTKGYTGRITTAVNGTFDLVLSSYDS